MGVTQNGKLGNMYKYTALGVLISLSAAVWYLHNSNVKLRNELTAIKAASALYKQQQQAKIEQVEQEYEQAQSDINSRYNAIIERLRVQADQDKRRANLATAQCESERSADANRMQSELLRSYANVARYADELKQRGLACEAISSGL